MLKILQYQHWHLLWLIVLAILLRKVSQLDLTVLQGSWILNTSQWLLLAFLIPVIHQVYVLLCWRSQLYYQYITKTFGSKGYVLYKVGFALLIALRPITVLALAYSNRSSLEMNQTIAILISALLGMISIYLAYSIRTYFGFDRAIGIDHFQPDRYREMPLVKDGIFRFTPNAMYVFGFLALWIPGLLLNSKAALYMAAFNHFYIWIHYFFTERPNMQVIYNSN